ncbi:MAG: ABC transporter ATP-binding protein [Acidobacteriota bacterium]|nr:MAG: ABC transporter ATP-binding protein [Acidobacteriota bacterium]
MNDQHEIVISSNRISKRFDIGTEIVHALREVSLEVRKGEVLAVMGPSGSGKSTLFNLLGGIDDPSEGEVLWNGRSIRGLGETALNRLRREQIGMVFQDDCLMSGLTVLDNARLPSVLLNTRDSKERSTALLERLGMGGYLTRLPRQLSRGERHRVAIARALANRPVCLLADEPTGNLDRKATLQTFSIFRDLSETEGLSVLIATHDEAVLDFADRRVVLSDGQIIEEVAR